MIQRIQTVYLFLAIVVGISGYWFSGYSELLNATSFGVYPIGELQIGLSIFLSASSIFLFRKRSRQLSLNFVNILLNVLFIGLLVFGLMKLPGGFDPQKGIGLIFPVLIVFLLLLANRGIRKDEKLVKSVDRIR